MTIEEIHAGWSIGARELLARLRNNGYKNIGEIDKEMRLERIQRLLHELKYEIHRGFMETEIDEFISYEFIVPVSRQVENGIVVCKFETRPVHRDSIMGRQLNQEPRLKLV